MSYRDCYYDDGDNPEPDYIREDREDADAIYAAGEDYATIFLRKEEARLQAMPLNFRKSRFFKRTVKKVCKQRGVAYSNSLAWRFKMFSDNIEKELQTLGFKERQKYRHKKVRPLDEYLEEWDNSNLYRRVWLWGVEYTDMLPNKRYRPALKSSGFWNPPPVRLNIELDESFY
jgi:hypothetical protein